MQKTRLWIAAMIYPMANAVIFGVGVTLAMTVPWLQNHLAWALSAAVALAFSLAVPVSWFIAPRMQARYWAHRREHEPGTFDAVVDEIVR